MRPCTYLVHSLKRRSIDTDSTLGLPKPEGGNPPTAGPCQTNLELAPFGAPYGQDYCDLGPQFAAVECFLRPARTSFDDGAYAAMHTRVQQYPLNLLGFELQLSKDSAARAHV